MSARNCRRDARILSRRGAMPQVCEPLEGRMLLASIVWDNAGDDGFAGFGSDAGVARTAIYRALGDWMHIINSFNYGDGTGTYHVTVKAADAGDNRAVTGGMTWDANGKPRSATITMGTNVTWYFDHVPGSSQVPDDSEFTNILAAQYSNTPLPFAANNPSDGHYDFYECFQHEMCHALGVVNGGALHTQLVDTGLMDPGAPDYKILTFSHGGSVETTFIDGPHGLHTYEGPTIAGHPELTLHEGDIINGGHTTPGGQRRLVSDTVAVLLRDAYGYSVTLPSQINTFYANLDTVSHVLTVQGAPGDHADVISIDMLGSDLQVRVNGTSELFDTSDVQSIDLHAGAGSDSINIWKVPSGMSLTVDAGDGNDVISVADNDYDLDILGNVTIVGGNGTNSLTIRDSEDPGDEAYRVTSTRFSKSTLFGHAVTYSSIDSLYVGGGKGSNAFYLESTSCPVTVRGGAGDDTFNVGTGNAHDEIQGDLFLYGEAGNDLVNIDDADTTAGGSYVFTDDTVQAHFGTLSYYTMESVVLNASAGDNFIDVLGQGAEFEIYAGGGDDDAVIHTPLTAHIVFNGGANATTAGDSLRVVGDGTDAICTPSGMIAGAGVFTIGAQTITYWQVESLIATNYSDFTLVTSNSHDDLTIDASASTENRITGKSGSVKITPLRFSSITRMTIDDGANDDVAGDDDDAVAIASPGMVASGLEYLRIRMGTGANSVSVDSGSAALDLIATGTGTVDLSVTGPSLVNFPFSQRLGDVSVGDASIVRLDSGVERFLRMTGLAIAPTGRLDLMNGHLILQSTAAKSTSDLDKITGYIRTARNGAAPMWRGYGLGSTVAAFNSPLTGLAVVINEKMVNGQAVVIQNPFAGVFVDRNCILVKYTWNGDADVNGLINFDDYFQINTGFLSNGSLGGYRWGDFNYQLPINFDDYFLINSAFLGQGNTILVVPAQSRAARPAAKRAEFSAKRIVRSAAARVQRRVGRRR